MSEEKAVMGTIVCPHCGTVHCGKLDPICDQDECGKPFWPEKGVRIPLELARRLTGRTAMTVARTGWKESVYIPTGERDCSNEEFYEAILELKSLMK